MRDTNLSRLELKEWHQPSVHLKGVGQFLKKLKWETDIKDKEIAEQTYPSQHSPRLNTRISTSCEFWNLSSLLPLLLESTSQGETS